MQSPGQLYNFLRSVLSEDVHQQGQDEGPSKDAFIRDVQVGLSRAPMSIRLTPHILSVIDWQKPMEDPIRRQFIPLGSTVQDDHPNLRLDSLMEVNDSPVKGLVHRYPDKALFLGASFVFLETRLTSF